MKTRILTAVAACAAIALSGCGINKTSESSTQLDVIGDVQISTTFCAGPGNSATDVRLKTVHSAGIIVLPPCATDSSEHRGQVLVGYRIPAGSAAPDTLPSTDSSLNFRRSDSYTTYLESTYHEDGMQWVGYISDPHTVPANSSYSFEVTPQFTLPTPGKPYVGPYPYFVVGGYRTLASSDDGSSDVSCSGTGNTCVTTTPPTSTNDVKQPTRDLGVLAGATPNTVVAGTGGTVTVPFNLRYAGEADDQADFDLSGSANVPGGTISLSRSTLKPDSDSDNPVNVDVQVPAGTPAGDYTVSLNAVVSGRGVPILSKRTAGKKKKSRKRRHTVRHAQAAAQPQSRAGSVTISVVAPAQVQQPQTPQAPAQAARAALGVKLTADPRKAYAGSGASYRVVARNTSRNAANAVRVCSRLPGNVQFRKATRTTRFSGQSVCFDVASLGAGQSVGARILVRIDRDAHAGQARASARATASNADRATARAALRVLRRAQAVRPAPVTG